MQVLLATERVLLRRFTEADVDDLFALDNDPEVMRFLSGGISTPREAIENEILPRFLRSYGGGEGYGFWAAIEKASREFLGWFSFRPTDAEHRGEVALGYRLRRTVWGHGYATEVSRTLIRKGFTDLGVRRVIATTYQDNLASRRVMEKLGMTLARTYRLTPTDLLAQETYQSTTQDLWDGDDVEYALERADWEWQEATATRRSSDERAT